MAIAFKGKKTLPSIDLNKITCDGDFYLSSSNTYGNSPVSGRDCHFSVKTFDAGNQQIEQTLTDRTTGYVYKRVLYNSYDHAFPASNTSASVPWYVLHGVGKTYASNFVPDTTNSRNLGSSSITWANVYTQNAVTVVSDRNAKNSIQAIDDKVLDAWAEVEQKQYKLNGDDNWSFGYIAQDIVDAFTKHGLDYKQYNIVHEEDGKFMLKYDMCTVLESALNRRYNKGVDR